MFKSFVFVSALIALMFLFHNCSDSTSPELNFERIDSKLNIVLREELTTESRNLTLNCRTERIYPCCNYGIDYSMVKGAKIFKVRFSKIVMPQICLTALGPAGCSINLGSLADGQYSLELEVNGKTEIAQLVISENTYQVNHQPGLNFKFENPQLNRIPQFLIWGSVGYINDSLTSVVNTFIDSLQILGAQQAQLLPGDYWYFKVDAQGNLIAPEYHGYPFIKMFAYSFNGSLNELKEFIYSYCGRYYNKLYISLSDWKGEVIYGWAILVYDLQFKI